MMPPINNLYGRDGFFWWMGVVEDREDPQFLGRCRVRIFGYHIENKELLPTKDLPWATALQPVTSAALSGVGVTPLGYLPGSWVVGFFADGKDCQQPIIMGSIGGVQLPTDACLSNLEQQTRYAPDVAKDLNGDPILDSEGKPVKIVPTSSATITAAPTNNTGPLIAAVGDSLAVGVGGALAAKQAGVTILATVGISTRTILENVNNNPSIQNARFAVCSGGGNDLADYKNSGVPPPAARITSVQNNIRSIRAALKAKAYVWILSRNRWARDAVLAVAREFGDRTVDAGNYSSRDGDHPSDYNPVAREVLGLLGNVGVGVNTAPGTPNNNLSTDVQPSQYVLTDLPPLSRSQVQILMNAIAKVESSSLPGGVQGYGTVNVLNYIGKYQFGAMALTDLGYIKWANQSQQISYSNNHIINDPTVWDKSRTGVGSAKEWLSNPAAQEKVMFAYLQLNYQRLTAAGVINPNMDPNECAGLLHAAHNQGHAVAIAYAKRGTNGRDGFKVSAEADYAISYNAMKSNGKYLPDLDAYQKGKLSFVRPKSGVLVAARDVNNGRQPPPNADPAGPLNDPRIGNEPGFKDPFSIYPTCAYANHPDTNKLATGIDIQHTIVKTKIDNAVKDIPVASPGILSNPFGLLQPKFSEQATAYAARYPHNKVFATEGGHHVEFDDTPGRERIHIYHKSGTFIEMDSQGTVNYHVEGENIEVNLRNKFLYAKGSMNITAAGPLNILAQEALNIESMGPAEISVTNEASIRVSGNAKLNVAGDFKCRARNIVMESLLDTTFLCGKDFRVSGVGNFGVLMAKGMDVLAPGGSISFTTARNINMQSVLKTSIDAAGIFLQSKQSTPAVPVPARPTLMVPVVPSIAGLVGAAVQNFAAAINPTNVAAAQTLGAEPGKEAINSMNLSFQQAIGVADPQYVAANEAIRNAGYTAADTTNAAVQTAGKAVSMEAFMKMEYPGTMAVSKNFFLDALTSKAGLSFLTTMGTIALDPVGNRNLSFGQKLMLGATVGAYNTALEFGGLSNTQKIIAGAAKNLAVDYIQGRPINIGRILLSAGAAAVVYYAVDTFKKNNPNLTDAQQKGLRWAIAGANVINTALQNKDPNLSIAQKLGLGIIGAGYNELTTNGTITSNVARFAASVGVQLISNKILGNDKANDWLMRSVGAGALGYALDTYVTSSITAKFGSSVGRFASTVLGTVVTNTIWGQRTNIREVIGYAAGNYISEVVYNSIISKYGTSSAGLAYRAANLTSQLGKNVITTGSLMGDYSGFTPNARPIMYSGGMTFSNGPNGGPPTGAQVVTNLKALAVNCLDAIKDEYPDMRILIGYLNTPEAGQLSTGQAAEFDFPKHGIHDYYSIARWIKDNLPFDQLLLQYEVLDGKPRAWIRLSYNLDGNRPVSTVYTKGGKGPKVATMVGKKLYRPFLVQMFQDTPTITNDPAG